MIGKTIPAGALETNTSNTFDLYLFDAGSSGGEGAASAGDGGGTAVLGSARGNAGGDPSKGNAQGAAQAGQVSRANKYRNVQRNAPKPAAKDTGTAAKTSGAAGWGAKSFSAGPGEAANAGEDAASETPDSLNPDAEFETLIRGKYREAFQKRADLIINRRFAQLKALEENQTALAPLISTLAARYGLNKDDIAGLAAAVQSGLPSQQTMARQRGMSPEEFTKLRALELQSAAIRRQAVQHQQAQFEQMRQGQIRAIHQKWRADSAATKAVYPGFDFDAENRNPDFGRLLSAGVPVRHAYEVIHRDEVLHGAMSYTAQKVRERVTGDILARGLRPQENGVTGQAAQLPGFEYGRLSRSAKAEIERRAMRGERVNPRDYMNYP